MKKVLAMVAVILLVSAPVIAQDACEGDFDCDQDVDGTDVAVFKEDFGRSPFSDPCPACNPCLYDMVDCGTKCVDPMTDGDFCGADSTCLGGTVCGNTERCVSGVCEQMVANCDIPAPVPRTGQTLCYDVDGLQLSCSGTGQDGEYQKGVAWPNPRFTDNNNGTITDNLTGLIWLKDANCFGLRTWNVALSDCNGLSSGQCDLMDGSGVGDWRLPNRNELFSLFDVENYDPALPSGHPFYHVRFVDYWSSSTRIDRTNEVWTVNMDTAGVYDADKNFNQVVWPVRGPE